MQASPVMHAFGAWMERIASPITAQLHHLSLICTMKLKDGRKVTVTLYAYGKEAEKKY